MAELRHFPQAGFQATWDNAARKVAPGGQPSVNVEKYCVYNQTRGRFVATSVEAVDASSGGQEARLRNLEPGAGAGLWLLPCPEISPTSIRSLVDLVYLNREGAVLAAVESFPLVKAAVSSTMAGSVLVLAEGTVAAGEVHIGDRLIVATPDEMKRHLQTIKEAKAAAQEAASSSLEQHVLPIPDGQVPDAAEPAALAAADHAAAVPVASASATAPPASSQWAWALKDPPLSAEFETPPAFEPPPTRDRQPLPAFEAATATFRDSPPVVEPTAFAPPARLESPFAAPSAEQEPPHAPLADVSAPPVGADEWKKKPAKGWFARLLQSEPEDARITSRESLPGLIAYYFTGGTPKPHAVRDISLTGMYILTEERWYPGTVIRVTLTDRHHPSTERSITVNAKAVRAGREGVGFEFVLEERDRGRVREAERMDRANGMSAEEIADFLRIYKSS
ncbi:MAG: PilZ domain-containing protein [Terracidiphilus sp.]